MTATNHLAPQWKSQCAAALTLCAVFWLQWIIYGFAADMQWGFDDWINLKGISSVSTEHGLFNFVFGGTAGPTGRPVSLLSFVPDYQHWPSNPLGFVQSSLIWHWMNTLLVFLLFYKLLLQHSAASLRYCLWGGALIAIYWSCLPIHASSILLPVQRMTHVAAFFTLASLNVYVYWRSSPVRALLSPATLLYGVAFGCLSVLGIYAKENAVLVVGYVALIELLFFSGLNWPKQRGLWKLLIGCGLLLVPLYLVYLFISHYDSLSDVLWHREFTLLERLATQPVVVWDYLRFTLFPRISFMGAFHDGYRVYDWNEVTPWLALMAWITLLALAVLGFLKRLALSVACLFAVSFFIYGHLLEGSVIPLELYFEHRNYLPTLGLAFLVVSLAFYIEKHAKNIKFLGRFILIALIAFNLFSLQQLAMLWGKPIVSAELWHKNFPNSTRAAQTLSNLYELFGDKDRALSVLDEFSNGATKGRIGTAMQAVGLSCEIESASAQAARFRDLSAYVEYMKRPADIVAGLPRLGELVRNDACEGIGVADYAGLLDSLLDHPRISNTTPVLHHVAFERALIEYQARNFDSYFYYAKKSFFAYPSISVAEKIAGDMFQRHMYHEAIEWLETAIAAAPSGMTRVVWQRQLGSMIEAISYVEQSFKRQQQAFPEES